MKTLNKKVVKDLNNIISDIVTELTQDANLTELFIEEAKEYFESKNYSYTKEDLKKLLEIELKTKKIGNNLFIGCLATVYSKMIKSSQSVTILPSLVIPSDFCLELLIWSPILIKYFPDDKARLICSNKHIISLLFHNTLKDNGIEGTLNLINILKEVNGSNNIFNNYVIMYSVFLDFKIIDYYTYPKSKLLKVYNAFSDNIKDKTKFLAFIDSIV